MKDSNHEISKVLLQVYQQHRRQVFILRRATWFGQCNIDDLVDAFYITRQAASRELIRATSFWKLNGQDLLMHRRGTVKPIPGAPEHPDASPLVMMELLRRDASFEESGLRKHEYLVLQQPLNGLESTQPHHLAAILRALIHDVIWPIKISHTQIIHHTLEIQYVEMKIGETIRTYWTAPLCLEFDGSDVRLWAYDLQAPGYPVKPFVLSRIAGASLSSRRPPDDLLLGPGLPGLPEEDVCLQATFDARLTQDQREAVARELNLDSQGRTKVARHRVVHLQRLYTQRGAAEAAETIWPPLVRLTEIKTRGPRRGHTGQA